MDEQHYIFEKANGEKIAECYSITAEQMKFLAMGMAYGMRQFRRHPKIYVFAIDEHDTPILVRVQQ